MASNPGSIPAGGKDKISVTVGTRNSGGHTLRKRFVVTTNDPKHSQIDLVVTGKVAAYAQIDPPYVRLIGRQGDPLSATVRITPQKGFPLTVTDVKTKSDQNIKVALKPMGKEGYQIVVTNVRTDVGTFRESVAVHTNLKQKPILYIPVSGRIQPRAPGSTKSPSKSPSAK